MKIIYYLATICLLISCNKQVLSTKGHVQDIANGEANNDCSYLPNDYFLNQRIPDCKESYAFMKSVIVPESSNVKFFRTKANVLKGVGDINISVISERNINNQKDLHHFYFDLSCLKDLSLHDLLGNLICNESDAKMILSALDDDENNNFCQFGVSIANMKSFGLVIRNGEIDSIIWDETVTSH